MLMELRQLKYFVAVTEEGSFTKAAAKVHVAQPGVSAQIRRLERELGQELLDRSGRTVRTTEAGMAVLPYARAALAAVAAARLVVDELAGLLRGHVAVGMVASSSSFDLPDLLAQFHHDHPVVEVTLSEANSDDLVAALHAGRLDVAFIGLGASAPAGLEIQVVVDELLVAVVGRGDVLAAQTTIALAALRERALISLPRGSGLRSHIDDACTEAGFQPHVLFEASDPHVLAELASRGLGVAILPESVAKAHRREIHALTINSPQLRGRIALAWRAEGPINPAGRVFIERVRAVHAPPPSEQSHAAPKGVGSASTL
jgi:DNA-binding transcriptional LysR family regulator